MSGDRILLDSRGLTAVCAALLLASLPHWLRLPAWVPLICVACIGWRLAIAWRGLPPVPATLRLGLTCLAVLAAWGHYGTVFGRDAGVALLVLMLSLKLLEVARLRDAFLVGALTYFLIATEFLFQQDVVRAVYMAAAVLAVTSALMMLQDPGRRLGPGATARRAGALLAQSVPLMAVMFLLFPRLGSPLWGVPELETAKTGLSGEMAPGSISQLLADDSAAFRVTFHGNLLPPDRHYWRGPVLWHYDGETWQRGRVPWSRPPRLSDIGDVVEYTVTVEPHHRHWLFALSMPLDVPAGAARTGDFELVRRRPVDELISYRMRSARSYVDSAELEPYVRRAALQWPDGYNPRTRELGQRWSDQLGNPEAVIERAISHFREQPFSYTLTPPLLGSQAMDEFLFQTRAGFCEHYASAFVLLMRAAGIPARVVTGYQGGMVNRLGGYVLVRQSDAHAWTEVWLEGRGWVAVDPTSAIDPARVEPGTGAAGMENAWRWTGAVGMTFDALQNLWNNWLLSYDRERQNRLLQRLGGGESRWRAGATWLAAGGAAALALGALWALRGGGRPGRDPAVREWLRFRRKLSRAGLRDDAALGPRRLVWRAARRWPDQVERLRRIRDAYIALRYKPGAPAGALERLRGEVGALRLNNRFGVAVKR